MQAVENTNNLIDDLLKNIQVLEAKLKE